MIVVTHPYCSPDPAGPQYEQYCYQSLMKHKPFHQMSELLAGKDNYAEAYSIFLLCGNVPPSLTDDIYRLQQHTQEQCAKDHHIEVCYSV